MGSSPSLFPGTIYKGSACSPTRSRRTFITSASSRSRASIAVLLLKYRRCLCPVQLNFTTSPRTACTHLLCVAYVAARNYLHLIFPACRSSKTVCVFVQGDFPVLPCPSSPTRGAVGSQLPAQQCLGPSPLAPRRRTVINYVEDLPAICSCAAP
jgi:hypothetical protein